MQASRHDAWVGGFVLLGGAALLFLALKAGNLLSLNFDETYRVTAKFDNIGGLKASAAVRSAGVVVGRVASIAFDDKTFQAKVVLNLHKTVVFPKDSSAKILTAGLLGEQYIGLEAGAEEKNLAPGDVITQTHSAIVLENLIGQLINNRVAEAGSKAPASSATPAEAPKP